MSMRFVQGDYVPDGWGGFQTLTRREELLQDVLFRLTVRRGSFPFLPNLGSRLFLLPREKPSARAALAEKYVMEAFAGEKAYTVTQVLWEEERQKLTVLLQWGGEAVSTSFLLERM